MSKIRFRCPHCEKIINAPEKAGGRRAKCPGCGEVVEIPKQSFQVSPDPQTEAIAPPPEFEPTQTKQMDEENTQRQSHNSRLPWEIPEQAIRVAESASASGTTRGFKVRVLKAKNGFAKAQVNSAVQAKGVLDVFDEFLLIDGRPPSTIEMLIGIICWFLSLPLLVLSLPALLLSILFLPVTLPLWIAQRFMQKKLSEWIASRVAANPDSMFTQWLVFLSTPEVPAYIGRESVTQVIHFRLKRFVLPSKYGIAFICGPPFPTHLGCLTVLPFMVGRRIHAVLFDSGQAEMQEALQVVETALQTTAVEGTFKGNRFIV